MNWKIFIELENIYHWCYYKNTMTTKGSKEPKESRDSKISDNIKYTSLGETFQYFDGITWSLGKVIGMKGTDVLILDMYTSKVSLFNRNSRSIQPHLLDPRCPRRIGTETS